MRGIRSLDPRWRRALRGLVPAGVVLLGIVAAGSVRTPEAAEPADQTDRVVVLHGLLRNKKHTAGLSARLEADGFDVVNLDYSSRGSIEAITALLADAIDNDSAPSTRLHLVGHSLGGIVVRAYLEAERPPNLGRVVLLGPPNQGSEVVDRMPQRLMRWIAGPAALELGTGQDSVPRALGPVDYDVGVIAGDRSIKRRQSKWIPGDDDGMVSVESTRVDGMRDHIVLPVHHQQLVKSPEVAAQVSHYLRNGRFDRRASPSVP